MKRNAVLITGAASGIGAALARRLAAPDVALLLHTRRNREGLEQVADEGDRAQGEVAGNGDFGARRPTAVLKFQRIGRVRDFVSNLEHGNLRQRLGRVLVSDERNAAGAKRRP